MPRLPHGMEMSPATLDNARKAVTDSISAIPLGPAIVKPVDRRRFDYLFLDLQDDPDNLLPESQGTRNALVELGEAMADQGSDDPAKDTNNLSAAYTYFGQFVDHDITFETSSATGSQLTAPDLEPLPLNRIRQETHNVRTALLELDSVYGLPAERDPGPNGPNMRIGTVQPVPPNTRPPGKDDFNDLPREGRSVDVVHDRAALIGDPRNDENLIVAQLHVAFLRAHNKLVDNMDPPNRFRRAKKRLRRHYQHIVLHDFLKRIADPQIVDDTIQQNRVYDPDDDNFFLPLEYSVAAFRFGHSMIRAEYDYNLNFNRNNPPNPPPPAAPTNRATLARLFVFTAFSGEIVGLETLPQNWIIQWENFFEGGQFFNKARRIDTELVEPLEHLTIVSGQEEGGLAAKLAVRNLLRGYLLRMPTGQAVAGALGIPVLTAQQIKDGAASGKQRQVLEDAGFLERTPLWYYVLAEAAVLGKKDGQGEGGQRLGPVGSTIVAEILVGLVRRSPDSILDPESDWEPNLPSAQPGTFTLPDLLRFAGVLD
jgi:Animal haem peroxidase